MSCRPADPGSRHESFDFTSRRRLLIVGLALCAPWWAPAAQGDGQPDSDFASGGFSIQENLPSISLDGPYPQVMAVPRGDEVHTVAWRVLDNGRPALRRVSFEFSDPGQSGDDLTLEQSGLPAVSAMAACGAAESKLSDTLFLLANLIREGESAARLTLAKVSPFNVESHPPAIDPAATQEAVGLDTTVSSAGPGAETRLVTASNERLGLDRWAVLRRFAADLDDRDWPNGDPFLAFAGAEAVGITVDGAGRILVYGRSDALAWIARVLPDGDPDNSFDDDGVKSFALGPPEDRYEIRRLVVGSNGQLYLLASQTDPDGFGQMVLGRLADDGSPVLSFGGDGFVGRPPGDLLAGLAVLGDGRVVVAGQRGSSPSQVRPTHDLPGVLLAQRFRNDGTPDPEFGSGGETELDTERLTPPLDGAIDVVLQSGRPVLYGFSASEEHAGLLFARLTGSGLLSDGFESGTLAAWRVSP